MRCLALLALLASCGTAATDPAETEDPPDTLDCSAPPQVGATTPLRRLTATQLENTVQDVLGLDVTYEVADEALIGYRANTLAAMDTPTARALQSTAESTAAWLAPRGARLADCTDEGCADFILDAIAPRLFRRPIPVEERGPYLDVYAAGFEAGGREEGLRWLLEALLQSPRFLHQLESTGDDGKLDAYSVAARLSYALWAGPPDELLLAAAADGSLLAEGGIDTAVAYMVADPRFERGLREWVLQWMHLEELHEVTERPDLQDLSPQTRTALEDEPVDYVLHHVRDGGTVFDLLASNETPAHPALADIYADDLEGSAGDLSLLDPDARAGLLTLPGVQAALSHARDTSPSRRGAAVLSQLLCVNPGAPPDDVSPTLPEPQPNQSKRERLEAHFSDPTCATCHETMDGFGFAYEHYDWFGRTRTTDNGLPLDTQVTIPWNGETLEADGAVSLSLQLADRRDVAVCVAKHWSRYASSVRENADAACLMEEMADAATGDGGLQAMIAAHARSDWFLRATPEGGP